MPNHISRISGIFLEDTLLTFSLEQEPKGGLAKETSKRVLTKETSKAILAKETSNAILTKETSNEGLEIIL